MEVAVNYTGWVIERPTPFIGYRAFVASTYMGFNVIGFAINAWVLYVVAPLLFAPAIKVPKSILFFIFALCVGDIATMIAMLLLIIEVYFATWQFSSVVCTSYLLFDSMNKFIAPMIVFLISRTCYSTVCLDKQRGERAASLKYAALQVLVAMGCVMVLLWPVFPYSQVRTFYLNPNATSMHVTVVHKCGFFPPQNIQFWFNLVACFVSYAVPLFGIIYWYVSVPFFLKRRAITTLVTSSSMDAAMKKVITTVLLLTAIYVLCWTPYWVLMVTHRALASSIDSKNMVVISYFIHLLPYLSCAAYPLIFTLLNRGIRSAHARIVADQRRRFKSLTDDASTQLRTAIRTTMPAKTTPPKKHNGVKSEESSDEKLVSSSGSASEQQREGIQLMKDVRQTISQLSLQNDETLL